MKYTIEKVANGYVVTMIAGNTATWHTDPTLDEALQTLRELFEPNPYDENSEAFREAKSKWHEENTLPKIKRMLEPEKPAVHIDKLTDHGMVRCDCHQCTKLKPWWR